ncbi:PIR Superfamily Protein [Plasmodium ovale curtisi]|uniref:PIR Superfamily Protein n=1 Tax=Plasmodium ovale curtisi TaxID=864141 RepID=A0A1A8WD27_PLAOA|nr:PIR Superfamily Protein [Plasmodium ovale curtisi]
MTATDTNNCELPSVKYYHELDIVKETTTYKNICDSDEIVLSGDNPFSKYPELKDFCYKLASNLESLEKKNEPDDLKKRCTHLQLWLQNMVINTVENRFIITCILLLNKVWMTIMENIHINNKNICNITHSHISVEYLKKWKQMYDYNLNYEKLKCAFQESEECNANCNESCKENYCRYILDIFNIHQEFEHVCNNGTTNQRCPDFWREFHQNYSETLEIESKCKDVYDKLGFYKVKMYFGDQDIEEYIYQYESHHIFSFFEKLIGYSIKYYLSKTIHYSKYIALPIILILLFYFFMKKLSFFGSKISPRVDNMRKMWINVQGVTNPATLLNPMKPPGGGNKIGLSYVPK